ncbi:hypothetical protein D4764_20G0009820 [Takifugu flavidus]|uniref:Uncharacterized protein n=1 Tax=Takifugu flavidus TaxID=433684 RepID=A0A5C6NLG4_9TELE|nr:hypothetical protein D4764_20G0009820 [Takifugu flavidus]
MVVQNLFEAVRKSFSMASPNSTHARVFASAMAVAAGTYLLPQESYRPRVRATTGTDHLAAKALVSCFNNGGTEHGLNVMDSMSPASPGTWSKLSRRRELKLLLTGDSARRFQQALTTRLGLPGLSGILPHHRSQRTTRW